MDIKGRDPATECYRVQHLVDGQTVTALVPERFAADFSVGGMRPSHEAAYTWFAAHKTKIETAIADLARGKRRPKAPYDQITLIEDH